MGHLPLPPLPIHLRLSNGPAHFSASAPSHCSTPNQNPWGWKIRRAPPPLLTTPFLPDRGLWGGGNCTDHRRNPPPQAETVTCFRPYSFSLAGGEAVR